MTQETIAHYRITAKLGAGGMGEVYRATDTKLGREVAIKVIPDAFARDSGRMARFRREAQVLASLNHPNIAAIYGVEEGALVMELVEGSTLAERIAAGPIPLEEALPIARQIAEALEYAHERGIVHRDLKPANIKITPEDRVKVLDFGLAKALSDGAAAGADAASSPTLTINATAAGMIAGTAAYMSPEQARGKTVDKRADIWAFGVVLLEMLTGRSVFGAATISDTLAAVLRSDADYSRLPANAPPELRRLIERCLERDPARRLRDMGDFWIAMELARTPEAAAIPIHRRRWLPWAAALAGAVLAAAGLWYFYPKSPPEPVVFSIQLPGDASATSPAVSPDGRSIAFVGGGSGGLRIYLRKLDSLEVKPLPGSEGANSSRPFWSPDSRRIGFFAAGKLKTVTVDDGNVQTLADGLTGIGSRLSGVWGSSGAILLNEVGKPIYRIPDSGGEATPVLPFDTSRHETAQYSADFLPDGKHFLYTSISERGAGIYEGSLDGSKPVLVLNSATSLGYARPAHATTGYLLFYRQGQILLRPFDPAIARVSGNAAVLESGVSGSANPDEASMVTAKLGSISDKTLVFGSPFAGARQITWLSREGKTLETVGDAGSITDVQISPDQRRLVFARREGSFDIWFANLQRGGTTRVTFNEGLASSPVFSPDGNRIAYFSSGNDGSAILVRSSNGAGGAEKVFETTKRVEATSWSHDGQWLASIVGEPGGWNIYLLPLTRDRKPVPVVTTPFDEYQPQFSPDGRWIAYTSNESGRYETYVVNTPEAAGGAAAAQGKWQISTSGGQQPRWRADGKELFFLSLTGEMMAVKIESNATSFRASAPASLFTTGLIPVGPPYLYDVSSDGRRFVALNPVGGGARPITVMVNWDAAMSGR